MVFSDLYTKAKNKKNGNEKKFSLYLNIRKRLQRCDVIWGNRKPTK